jgi:WD40 repeat protein
MDKRTQFSAEEQALIARVEKAGASLENNQWGWGFFHAGDKALKLAKGLASIQFFDLFEACEAEEVSDEGLAHIESMTGLHYLALGPGVSDAGLVHLAGLKELRELRLDNARDVTDQGLESLKKLTRLKSLSLQYTDVAGPGLIHLAGLKQLRELNLQGTPVGREAVDALQKALPKCNFKGVADTAPATAKKNPKKATSASATGVAFKVRATLRGHANKPSDVVFSPDGSLMASVAFNKVLLWDGVSGKKLRPISLKRGSLWGGSFTPDNQLFASGSNLGCVFLWETSSGKERMCLETDNPVFTAIDIDPKGKYVAAGGQDGKVYLWELSTGKLLQSFQATAGDFFGAVAFNTDSAALATSGRESFVTLWHVPSGKKAAELHGPPSKSQYELIRDVAFRPDGTSLAVAHPDGLIRLWNTSTAKEIAALRCPTAACALAFHPGGTILATSNDGDTLVRLWDVSSGKEIAEFQTGADWNKVEVVAFSPHGDTLATNGKGGSLLLLDVVRG